MHKGYSRIPTAGLLSRQNITPETQALVEQFSAMLKNREKE